MSCSDTRLGNAESDTFCLRLTPGEKVRIVTGTLAGLEGTVIEQRAVGRFLVEVVYGVHVEINQYCLEPVDAR